VAARCNSTLIDTSTSVFWILEDRVCRLGNHAGREVTEMFTTVFKWIVRARFHRTSVHAATRASGLRQ
jgi:hypothetical protein